jgi:hypothetical protein
MRRRRRRRMSLNAEDYSEYSLCGIGDTIM